MTKTLPSLPCIKPWYRVAHEGSRMVFHHADSLVLLEGKAVNALMPTLLPLLDGQHEVEEIEQVMGERARPAISGALGLLAEKNLLIGGPGLTSDDPASSTVAFMGSASADMPLNAIRQRLATVEVGIIGTSPIADEMDRTLERSSIRRIRRFSFETLDKLPTAPCDLVIAAPNLLEVPMMRDLNRQMLQHNQPWMQMLEYDGRFMALGPVFIPRETACYECYLLRRKSNASYPDEFTMLEQARANIAQAPALTVVAAGMGSLIALRWLVLKDATLPNAFQAFSPAFETSMATHHLLRVPRCSACSEVSSYGPPMPWYEV